MPNRTKNPTPNPNPDDDPDDIEDLHIFNDGPDIISTNYWQTDLHDRGFFYISVNAGCFRLLVPEAHVEEIPNMLQDSRYVIISIIDPAKWAHDKMCVEWMFEDRTPEPYLLHMGGELIDRTFRHDHVGQQWQASLWRNQDGTGEPVKVHETKAYLQIVPSLPWGQSIESSTTNQPPKP